MITVALQGLITNTSPARMINDVNKINTGFLFRGVVNFFRSSIDKTATKEYIAVTAPKLKFEPKFIITYTLISIDVRDVTPYTKHIIYKNLAFDTIS